jgi:1-acyl-sn-glycerol-3-phosphate acyltransferase
MNNAVTPPPSPKPLVTAQILLGSSVFTAGLWLATIAWAPVCLLFLLAPYRVRYYVVTRWTFAMLRWLELTCSIHCNIIGQENIPLEPCIIASKHQSAWETLALQKLFYPQTWVLKRELLWIPFFGWGLWLLEPIAINRKAGRKALTQLVEQGRERLEAKRWVVIFPEGTRVPPGERRPYGVGAAALAKKTGFPLLPITHNAGEFWPKRGFLKYPGTITLRIGQPFTADNASVEHINQRLEAWLDADLTRPRPSNIPN